MDRQIDRQGKMDRYRQTDTGVQTDRQTDRPPDDTDRHTAW